MCSSKVLMKKIFKACDTINAVSQKLLYWQRNTISNNASRLPEVSESIICVFKVPLNKGETSTVNGSFMSLSET